MTAVAEPVVPQFFHQSFENMQSHAQFTFYNGQDVREGALESMNGQSKQMYDREFCHRMKKQRVELPQ